MKIKYISCDGETEVEEEIIDARFFENKITVCQFLVCTRPDMESQDYPYFEVHFDKVLEITE